MPPRAAELHWIVPGRRVVVRAPISYQALMNDWWRELLDLREALGGWYDDAAASPRLNETTYSRGLTRLRRWIRRTFGELTTPTTSDPAGEAAVDVGGEDFGVRLWRGPLRVLREAAGTAALPTEGGVLRPADAAAAGAFRLLMGDVVELPLFRFLTACGLVGWDALEFNPEGSFLLGTSVQSGTTSPPTSPRLHDNLLAMRFQLVVNLGMGAFYHDAPTWTGTQGPRATGGVTSRGMLYAGSASVRTSHMTRWGHPAGTPARPDFWRLDCLQWATSATQPHNVPSTAGHGRLQPRLPVTPGWACSPFTLFLLQYLADEYDGFRFNSGVMKTMGYAGGGDDDDDDAGSGGSGGPAVAAMCEVRLAPSLERDFPDTPQIGVADGEQVERHLAELVEGACLGIVSLTSHEFAFAVLHPHETLARSTVRPQAGFLAAYHPLSGEPQVTGLDDDGRGTIFHVEAADVLKVSAVTTTFGAAPWKLRALGGSGLIRLSRSGSDVSIDGRDAGFRSLICLKAGAEGSDDATTLAHKYRDPRVWREVVIGPNLGGAAMRRTFTDQANTMYHDRAVPFRTMTESAGAWATHEAVAAQMAANVTRLEGLTSAAGIVAADQRLADARAALEAAGPGTTAQERRRLERAVTTARGEAAETALQAVLATLR